MFLPETPRPALDSALEKQRVELADLITRHTQQDGSFETRIKALFVSRCFWHKHGGASSIKPLKAHSLSLCKAQG